MFSINLYTEFRANKKFRRLGNVTKISKPKKIDSLVPIHQVVKLLIEKEDLKNKKIKKNKKRNNNNNKNKQTKNKTEKAEKQKKLKIAELNDSFFYSNIDIFTV